MAWAIDKPFVGVNHILAHLYASRLRDGSEAQQTSIPSSAFSSPEDTR